MADDASTPRPAAEPAPPRPPHASGTRPSLTVPQLLAFVAFGLLAALALLAEDGRGARVTAQELEQMGTLTMFLIGALLPSDALIRYGRNILFRTVEDPDAAAQATPATTLAQMLCFGTFVIMLLLTLPRAVSPAEFEQINEVARVLIVALLPSDAGIRFGRALYFTSGSTPQPGAAELRRI